MIERGEFAEADFPLDVTWKTTIFLSKCMDFGGMDYDESSGRKENLYCRWW